ncbi:sensor histidine kinase [Acidobacterium sp. S8]|uniref:sensor histidine kinase n=1 Tax=Acidobacterium sp. S8 TaxID=1641854 RepID=UPI00131C4CBB|nr:sensor histidine kinase [Acidobacterium sp. S8]
MTPRSHSFLRSRVFFLACIALLLAAAIVLYLRSPWRGLPYHDTFASGQTDEWTPYSGNWSLADGAVKNDSSDRGAKFATGSSYWRDYSVEADMLLLGGGDAGLIVRASDIERGVDSYNGYYAGLRTTDQSLLLGRAEHGWIEYPPVKMPGGVKEGTWYHLKIGAFGCSISVSATAIGTNNEATITAHDPHCFTHGSIALRSMVAGGIWRNLRVEKLSREEAALLASAKAPSKMALYPTNQGSTQAEPPPPHPPEAPHTVPLQSIQSLRLFSSTHPARARIHGSVILTNPLYIQDSTGGVQVDLKQPASLRVGDEVEAQGDVYPHGLTATLRNATFASLSGVPPNPPLSITADQAATGAYHAMFVEVEGDLYRRFRFADGAAVLEMSDGAQIFRAIATSPATTSAFQALQPRSLVRLRGVCLVDATHTQNTVPFVLLVSSTEDIKVLVGPPWWSMEHIIILAFTMLGLGFLVHLVYSRAEEWRLRAVIDERERLAHEIHDTLAQSFAGIGFQLRAIRNRISKSNTPLQNEIILEELNRASDLVRHSHDEARRSITTLRPDATEANGLITALEQTARQMVGRAPVVIEANVEGEAQSIPLRVLDSLFRIGQESIANAIQHGHPSHLLIKAIYAASGIRLIIEDNGSGFTPKPESDGFGLTGIRRRAEGIDGTLEIHTTPGTGTRIIVDAPIPKDKRPFWRFAYDDGDGQEPRNHAS